MKNITRIIFLCLIACQSKPEKAKTVTNHPKIAEIEQSKSDDNELFILHEKISENFVKIIPPKNSDFEFPDDEAKLEPYKHGDFNADGKQDILVFLGACGTGGCMYGLFLNQSDNYYKLAFMDYLKNPEFITEKDGLWTIQSSEELEPYNPSKVQVTTFKFDKKTDQYELDKTYVSKE
ncbi:hypothetical protein [Epilithonimonas zeae]|uniref:hypothetical protein n=1 Tax=Epilithonimonas zeae TaxID=1416779 RepID=UPI00200C7E8B|nr:hypothetical protein [Epilithonimonas zeae]UQB69988.1 hypothetical protein KI430_06055 [Epilithonimonas zeae]